MNNNRSLLVGAFLCLVGSALMYACKWVNIYFSSASLWQVADTYMKLERYLGIQGYKAIGICIKGGAILSLIFMAIDAYKVLKPLLDDNKSDLSNAKSAGKGSVIVSVIFTFAFAILIYSVNEGELDGASITLWPVVSVALCVVSRLMLGHIETVAETEAKQLFDEGVPAQEVEQESTMNEPEYDAILEALDYADNYNEFISILDQCIEDGLEGIEEIKEKCITLKKRDGYFSEEYLKEAKKAVVKRIKT